MNRLLKWLLLPFLSISLCGAVAEDALRHDMTEQQFLAAAHATSFDRKTLANGVSVRADGRGFGKLDIEALRKGDANSLSELKRFLALNEPLLGPTGEATFRIKRAGSVSAGIAEQLGRTQGNVRFSQEINGLQMPDSMATSVSGEVVSYRLHLADAGAPIFDRSHWLPETQLNTLAEQQLSRHYPAIAAAQLKEGQYHIVETQAGDAYELIYRVQHGSRAVAINVLTGDVRYDEGVVEQ